MNMLKFREKATRKQFLGMLILSLILIAPTIVLAAPGPVILYTDITSGPNTGGENNNGAYLSIFGRNFGNDIDAITVTVGGGTVARKMYLGTSYGRPDIQWLAVQLGSKAVTGAIKITVGGVASNTDKTFTVRSGNFFYVSLTGNDGTGVMNDITHPYRTPNYIKGLAGFHGGDFIIVRGGTYDLNDGTNGVVNTCWLRITNAGTDGNPKTFMGYPGETVIAQIDDATVKVAGTGSSAPFGNYSYWVISNIKATVTSCNHANIYAIGAPAASSYCLNDPNANDGVGFINMVNLEVTGNDQGLMCINGSGVNPIVIAYSHDVKLLGVSVHNGGPPEGSCQSHVFYLAASQKNTEVGWCTIHDMQDGRATIQIHEDGFTGCYGNKTLTDIKVHDNVLYNLFGEAIVFGGSTGDIYFYNNLIYNTPRANPIYSDIISVRGNGNVLNARIYNNTLYANPNNTGVGKVITFGAVETSCTYGTANMYNNIFYVTESQDIYWADNTGGSCFTKTSDYNIWYGSSDSIPTWHGTHDKLVNPLFFDASKGKFQLTALSPAIGAGTSELSVRTLTQRDHVGVIRPVNNFDIGAFQYVTNPIVPSSPILR